MLLGPEQNRIKLDRAPELPNIPVDEGLLQESLDELSRLIGMDRIKAQINEMVRLVRFYRQSNRDVLNSFFLHTVFIGNPGTGSLSVVCRHAREWRE